MPSEIYKRKPCSTSTKLKISLANFGYVRTDSMKQNIKEGRKNGKIPDKKHYKKQSKIFSGKGNPFFGKKHTEETLKKLRGENCHLWKGGVTPVNKKIRMSLEYSNWRTAVFNRDNFTCQKYKTRGGELHPHHIKNFSDNPQLRFKEENGITLSKKAHREFHKKYGRINNTTEQLREFLTFK